MKATSWRDRIIHLETRIDQLLAANTFEVERRREAEAANVKLLKVVEKAKAVVADPNDRGWDILCDDEAAFPKLEALAEALVALEAPVQETAGKNSALEKQRDYAQRAAYHEAAMRLALEACEAGEVATAIVALRWQLEAPVPEERA